MHEEDLTGKTGCWWQWLQSLHWLAGVHEFELRRAGEWGHGLSQLTRSVPRIAPALYRLLRRPLLPVCSEWREIFICMTASGVACQTASQPVA